MSPRSASRPSPAAAGLAASAVAMLVVAIGWPGAFTGSSASAAVATIGTDGFDRAVATGWGRAGTGGSWTVIGGTSRAARAGNGVVTGIAAGRSFRAWLASTSAADATVTAAFLVPHATEVYFNTEARRQAGGHAYRGRVRIRSTGRLYAELVRYTGSGTGTLLSSVPLSTFVSAGQSITVKLMVSGTGSVTLRAKAWITGTSEPGWQSSYADASGNRIATAGAVGVGGANAAGNPAVELATQSFSATSGTSAGGPPPPPPDGGAVPSSGYGSASVGSTAYAVPSGAIFVSPGGSDANPGTISAPVKTVTTAIGRVAAGGTIVLRAGTYHEYVLVPPAKRLTLQPYPHEAVWLDGSTAVSGFTRAGTAWSAPWSVRFDSSPTYVKGAPDGTSPGWAFINPAYPMAAHPDAVWVNGAELTQAAGRSAVRPGTFYVDYASKTMYLGTDPTGKTVRASDLSQAMSLRAPGTVVRGIGVRRYADSVWMQGVINSYYARQTLENVVVQDSATGGIGLYGANSTIRNVTVEGSGQLGISAHHADGLTLANVSVRNSNDQNFNPAPAAGGIKVTTTRGVTVQHSMIANTVGNSLWFDESVHDITAVNNVIQRGDRYGVVLEISSTATIAGNLITNTGRDGILVTDTDKVSIWNNTVVNVGKSALLVCQDTRRISNLSIPGHDKRRPQPDRSMPWVVGRVSVANNIFGASGGSPTILDVEAYDRSWAAGAVLSGNGNVFARPTSNAPATAVVWGRIASSPVRFATLAAYTAASGNDKNSFALIGSAVGNRYLPVPAVSAREAGTAQALPAAVAIKVGQAAGARHLGAWVG